MARPSERLELVFVGCGSAARRHARTIRRLDPTVGLHFASRDTDRARAFARDLGHRDASAFGTYDEAVRSVDVDAVVITTPPDRHLDLTLAALEAGKDVVVEKPAFFDPAAFHEVRSAADAAGRRVLVAENYFYKPVRRRLAGLVTEGVVGEPLLVRVNAVKRQEVGGWRADPARSGGGGLFEGGIHWINFVSNLGMEVRGVRGHRAGPVPEGPADPASVEESMVVVFDFGSGAVGTLAFSWEVPSPLRGVRLSTIYGREGSIWFESNGIFLLARGRRTRFSLPGLRDLGGFRAMWGDFLTSLRHGREPEMTLSLAERDVRLVRDAYRSASNLDG